MLNFNLLAQLLLSRQQRPSSMDHFAEMANDKIVKDRQGLINRI